MADSVLPWLFRFPGTDCVCCGEKREERKHFFDKKPLQIDRDALYYVYYSDR